MVQSDGLLFEFCEFPKSSDITFFLIQQGTSLEVEYYRFYTDIVMADCSCSFEAVKIFSDVCLYCKMEALARHLL